jgi:CBS domain-containing protein
MASIDSHVTREIVTLDGSASCREAARVMKERRIGAVAVKREGRVIGLVTERDLVLNLLADGGEAGMPIERAMRRDLPRIPAGSSETACSDLMRDHYTRHLLVEERGQVVGVISMRDVIRLMLDEKQSLIEQLQGYISGH